MQSLLRSKRQQLHRRIADALEEQFAEMVETQPELMAHHLAQAGLTEPAIDYLRKAGQRAIQRSANAEAIRHLKPRSNCCNRFLTRPERTRKALELQVLLGQAMIAGRGYAAAETREVLLRRRRLLMNSPSLRRSSPSSTGYGRATTLAAKSPCSRGLRRSFLPRPSGMATTPRSVLPIARSAQLM